MTTPAMDFAGRPLDLDLVLEEEVRSEDVLSDDVLSEDVLSEDVLSEDVVSEDVVSEVDPELVLESERQY